MSTDLLEVRFYGLNISKALGEYLCKGDMVRLRGILLHPQVNSLFQWAQVWVSTELEVASLLALRDVFAGNGITISHIGLSSITPPQTTWDLMSQLSKPMAASSGFSLSGASPPFPHHHHDSSLPRNLYILNLPLDLTQIEFKSLFTAYGVVEHSVLLSQLDGIGRRRGFVLMSCHREAADAMCQMHGKWIDGSKLDVSWALVQRETKSVINSNLPNRVVHPPTVSARRETTAEFDVIDPSLFPDAETVTSIFRSFGPIDHTLKLSSTSALIHFDSSVSASALVRANGLRLGERILKTLPASSAHGTSFETKATTDWLDQAFRKYANHPSPSPITPQSLSSSSHSFRLNAESLPFRPGSKSSSTADLSGLE